MRQSIEREMLEVLELFYYATSFQGRRFLCCFGPGTMVSEMLLDLRLLHRARLEVCLLAPGLDPAHLPPGYPVLAVHNQKELERALKKGLMPLLPSSEGELMGHAFGLAKTFGVSRILWLGQEPGLLCGGKLQSFLDLGELKALVEGPESMNFDRAFLGDLWKHLKHSSQEWVFVEAKSGSLFQEVFTHQGCGTLVARSYQKSIAKAQVSDLLDVMLLMRPYAKSGVILPVGEEQLAKEIGDYWVYRLGGSIVVTARTRVLGDWVELGKFCSLPRYQGKGRARELVAKIAEEMAAQGAKYLFALTVEPKMGTFFERMGFEKVERETLPKAWAKGYDFSRPSVAYRLALQSK